MIKTLAENIVNKYDNLSPSRKALADMSGMLICALIGGTIVGLIVNMGLWFEVAIGFIVYGIYGMLSLIYKSRVAYYEFEQKYGKKG